MSINFILVLLIYLGIFSVLSLSLNLITGYTGLLSLCHAAFMSIGAYTTAIILTRVQVNLILVVLISGLMASFFGLLIGLPTLRLKGDYLAIATLGFGEIVRNVIINWDAVTNGPFGIHGIPFPTFFGYTFSPRNLYQFFIMVWIAVFITYFVLDRLMKTRFGRALEAIREDEVAAVSMGINIAKYKIFSFMVGAFFAGVAGSLWVVYLRSVSANSFDFMMSVMILCMVVLGGLGNNFAAIVGAVILTIARYLPQLTGISSLIKPQYNQILFGGILVFMMIYRPQGLLGRKKPDFERFMKFKKKST